MASPEKKNKNKEMLLLSLPDALLLSCIARISRFYYPTLSLVSKRFRSLILSHELYKVRSLLGHTESSLYLCFNIDGECKWFILWRKPNQQTLTDEKNNKKSSGYVLSEIPIPSSPLSHSLGLVAVGFNIYNFVGSNASILDCTSHTWREAPSLEEKVDLLCASVVDQKIYVAGCYKDGDSESSEKLVVMFDTKTEVWDPVPISCSEIQSGLLFRSACIDGKFHMRTNSDVVAYNSEDGKWDHIEGPMREYMLLDSYGVIDNVLYNGFNGEFRWYDTEERMWKEVKGLVGLPKFGRGVFSSDVTYVKLADYGGKMIILWYKAFPYSGGYKKVISCAEIVLKKRKKRREIWGIVEWFDDLLTVNKSSGQSFVVVKALAATF